MPAAIRIDIDLRAVQNSDEFPSAAKERMRALADKLAAAARQTLTAFFEVTPQEEQVVSEARISEGVEGKPGFPEGAFTVAIVCDLG